MPDHEVSISRAPIEIWVEIFEHYLGPSLVHDPIHSSLRDYERFLFLDEEELIRLYKRRERRRGTLRLVSRLWKLVADQLSFDHIAFVHPEGHFRLPPHCDILSAKRIYYLSDMSETYLKSLPEDVRDAYRYREEPEPRTLIFGENASLAPITHVQGYHIIFPNEPSTIDRTPARDTILCLCWLYPAAKSDWMYTLRHTRFCSLVALEIVLWGDPPWSVRPELLLPNLRCLIVRSAASTVDILAHCLFPALQYLAIANDYTSTILHIVSFIQRHFATITDLKLSLHRLPTRPDEATILASCHNGLPRLEIYTTQNLCSLGSILPHVLKIIATSHEAGAPSGHHLTVRLMYAEIRVDESKASGEALTQLQQVSGQIKLEIQDTWQEMSDQLSYRPDALLVRRRFIDTINRIKLQISDSEGFGWRSKAARRYASDVRRMLDDLHSGRVGEGCIREDEWE